MLYLPQRGVRSSLYLPRSVELPKGDVHGLVFDFSAIGAQGTAVGSQLIKQDFLVTHFTAVTDAPAGSAFVQWVHQHGAGQRLMNSQRMRLQLIAGANGNAMVLRSPYLLVNGDTLSAKIANTGTNGANPAVPVAANIELVAWGVFPDPEGKTR
jgi:hypothetical protein